MAKGAGKGSGDGALARQILELLQRQCGGDQRSGGGARRGDDAGERRRGGSSRTGITRGERQRRDGDWTCGSCGFEPNFHFRVRCWQCGEARAGRQVGGGGGPGAPARSPIGADGQRPLLGGRAAKPAAKAAVPAAPLRSPTHRVPGSSLAAPAAGARAAARPAAPMAAVDTHRGGTAWGPGAKKSPSSTPGGDIDEEGFRVVQGKGKRRTNNGDGHDVGSGGGAGTCDADIGATTTHDGLGKHGRTVPTTQPREGEVDEGEEDADDDAVDAPGPAELRKRWMAEVAITKQLARQGLSQDHPAMAAATTARDAAEKKWRDAKEPAPIAKRLGWAHQKLDRAIEIQAETRSAIAKLEEEFNSRRAELQVRLDADVERVQKRRRQLDEVQGEAGADSPSATAPRGPAGEAVRRACGTIRDKVAPALSALAEQLGTGTEAWATVNGLLSSLAESQQVLEEAAGGGEAEAETYDIADGDQSDWSESLEVDSQADGGRRGGGNGGRQGEGSSTHEADTWAQRQLAEQYEQWQSQLQQERWHRSSAQLDPAMDDAMGDDGQQWQPWDGARWGEPKWCENGHGRWARTSWADSWEQEHAHAHGEGDGGEPQNKQRRLQEPAAVSQRTEPAASGGAAAETQPNTEQLEAQRTVDAARQHAELLAAVTNGAIAAGIQPITESGTELHLLDKHQLAAWAAEHLPSC